MMTEDDDDPFACFGDDDDDEDNDDDDDDLTDIKTTDTTNTKITSSKAMATSTTSTPTTQPRPKIIHNDQNTTNDADTIRKRLIEKANHRIQTNMLSKTTISHPPTSPTPPSSHNNDEDTTTTTTTTATSSPLPTPLTPWPDHPPLHHGPMIISHVPPPPVTSPRSHDGRSESSVGTGGNRECVAARDLLPGTLLLVEEPIYTWPEVQIGRELGLESLLGIFGGGMEVGGDGGGGVVTDGDFCRGRRRNGQEVLWDMEMLHPTREQVDARCRCGSTAVTSDHEDGIDKVQIVDMIEEMRKRFSKDPNLVTILKLARENSIVTGRRRRQNTGKPGGTSGHNNQKATAMNEEKKAGAEKDQTDFDEIDVYRTMLALRYNGFGSGVYLHFAMLNHSNDSNCIKYMPEHDDDDDDDDKSNHPTTPNDDAATTTPTPTSSKPRRRYSELRTTKYVKRGEALTLHYLDPREVSHATRRWHLWDQHRFDIGPGNDDVVPKSTHDESSKSDMDLVNGVLPPSSIRFKPGTLVTTDDDHNSAAETPTVDVESALTELEDLHRTSRAVLTSIRASDTGSSITAETATAAVAGALEQVKALEMAAFELIGASVTKLQNERHVLLIRICRLHLDAVESLLGTTSAATEGLSGRSSDDDGTQTTLTHRQQLDVMCRFLPTCHRLLSLQISYLGEHHPDLARTYLDMAMGIGGLLSRAPKRLFALDLWKEEDEEGGGGGNNFRSWSMEENRCRKEYGRIKGLYPRDVEERLLAK